MMRKRKKERKKERKWNLRKRKNIYKYVKKIKIEWTPRFSKVHYEFQGFKIKRSILNFPTMCNPITRTSFVPRDHSSPFAHVHLSQVCVFFSFPSLI
jgi:hypothetical protein